MIVPCAASVQSPVPHPSTGGVISWVCSALKLCPISCAITTTSQFCPLLLAKGLGNAPLMNPETAYASPPPHAWPSHAIPPAPPGREPVSRCATLRSTDPMFASQYDPKPESRIDPTGSDGNGSCTVHTRE